MIPVVTLAFCVAVPVVTAKALRDPELFARLAFDTEAIRWRRQWSRFFSSALVHGNWPHCIFNLIGFFLFAEPMEIGLPWGSLFLLAVVLGAEGVSSLTTYMHHYRDPHVVVGSSGVVCGVIFASVALFPWAPIGDLFMPPVIPGWVFAIAFLIVAYVAMCRGLTEGVSHVSHFGGAAGGLLVAMLCFPRLCWANPIVFSLLLAVAVTGLVLMLRGRCPWTEWRGISWPGSRQTKVAVRSPGTLDRLLDRVSQVGINGLTVEERRDLRRLSAEQARRRGGG